MYKDFSISIFKAFFKLSVFFSSGFQNMRKMNQMTANEIARHILRMWDYAWVRAAFRHTLTTALEALAMRREGP